MAKLEKWSSALPLHLPPQENAALLEQHVDLKMDTWVRAMQSIDLTVRKAGGCGGNDGPFVGD
jgi:hypothetical protein